MSDNDMIERVARAIYDVFESRPEYAQAQMNGLLAEEMARAAIAAMREPSEGMEFVGGIKCEEIMFGGDPDGTGVIFSDMGHVYRAMIDHILDDKGQQ